MGERLFPNQKRKLFTSLSPELSDTSNIYFPSKRWPTTIEKLGDKDQKQSAS